jgi:hypothetical protein
VTTAPATGFDRATAVSPLGGGAGAPDCDPGLWVARGPNGGCLAALVVQAMAMHADAWIPSPFVRLHAPVAAPAIDLTIHFRARAAAGAVGPDEPVLAVFRSSTAAGNRFEEDGEIWTRDGVLLAQSRQLAQLSVPGGEARG